MIDINGFESNEESRGRIDGMPNSGIKACPGGGFSCAALFRPAKPPWICIPLPSYVCSFVSPDFVESWCPIAHHTQVAEGLGNRLVKKRTF